ncbi:MAG: hypothetical protein ABEI57_01655 [Halapricum sp.]
MDVSAVRSEITDGRLYGRRVIDSSAHGVDESVDLEQVREAGVVVAAAMRELVGSA